MWWNIDQSGGPVVEQGTHFCDLARFLVGEINLDTVQAIAIKQTDPLGELKALAPNVVKLEERLEAHKRIPRGNYILFNHMLNFDSYIRFLEIRKWCCRYFNAHCLIAWTQIRKRN